jgi:steroid delta-isomerase
MKELNDLIFWYENLTVEDVEKMKLYYSENAFFKDPFNELDGINNIKLIFLEMFKKLNGPRFKFIDSLVSGEQAFVTWDFYFYIDKKKYVIHGSSHLKFNKDSLIDYHRDYWDVGEELLLKIPLIKTFYHIFRKKLSLAL